ncbi:MAG: GNAT family N-acetyltransferase [Anaerolineae bacterium]|nr:GNAT family N-acetyltransferase [Anaerolineae bacterium]
MRIIEVDTTNRAHVNRFIGLPSKFYRDCPQWVPQLRDEARIQIDRRRNPFYQQGDAAFFLAERDGQDVGRICAMDPHYYNEFKKTKQTFFYLFDSIDDQAVANTLFDAAAGWAANRNLTLMRGPLGFMAADGFGMLAKGFEHRPAIGIPYNYPYYPRLAEGWGFELEERVFSGYSHIPTVRQTFPQKVLRTAEKVKERYGFSVKNYNTKDEIRKFVVPHLVELYNRTLTHIAGDPPVSPEVIDVIADNLLLISDPKLHKFIFKDDKIVGFVLCFPDISDGFQKSKGRLWPFGWFHILRDFKRTKWLNMNGIGILPEYQGMGGPALLYAELYKTLKDNHQYEHVDWVQVSENNPRILNELKTFEVDLYKTHHIYRKEL